MTDTLKIALAPANPRAGDIDANVARLLALRAAAADNGADLVVFGELCVTGYPIDDLVLRPAFQAAAREAVETLTRASADGGPGMIVGAPWLDDDRLYNAAFLLEGGRRQVRLKRRLPDYGPFDESRVFRSGAAIDPVDFRGRALGVMICEDMWFDDASLELVEKGAEILIAPHASPYRADVIDLREVHARKRATRSGRPMILVNQLGGQDELVFEGDAFVVNADGALAARGPRWREEITMTEWRRDDDGWRCMDAPQADGEDSLADDYAAIVTGLRDYAEKNGFKGVVLGMSGGIDSALVAALACDALGPEQVRCVMMPTRFTSAESLEDAKACAAALGASYESIVIEAGFEVFTQMLAPAFKGLAPDVAEENLQSRIRGLLLMALSNKFGPMLLATGNKSELATGYATLYGDMCGGYMPLKDVYKTRVFALSRWRNAHKSDIARGRDGAVIPERILTKAPSAELKDNQTDQDTLPPYDVLDDILKRLIEMRENAASIAADHGADVTARVERMLRAAEYKRFQSAPGPKLTEIAFGRDRRYPLTNGFLDSHKDNNK